MPAVLTHDGNFFRRESTGFTQNRVGYRHLADVVQEGAASDDADAIGAKAHGAGDGDGEGGDALGVALGLGIFQVKCVAQGFEGDVVGALQVRHGLAQLLGASLNRASRFVW